MIPTIVNTKKGLESLKFFFYQAYPYTQPCTSEEKYKCGIANSSIIAHRILKMGRIHKTYLAGRIYSCAKCQTHLAQNNQVMSKAFQRSGKKAYLFFNCENIELEECEDRILLNGVHTVANIRCIQCKNVLGWKYVHIQKFNLLFFFY